MRQAIPPTTIAPSSELINSEHTVLHTSQKFMLLLLLARIINRQNVVFDEKRMSEDRVIGEWETESQCAEVSVTLTVMDIEQFIFAEFTS